MAEQVWNLSRRLDLRDGRRDQTVAVYPPTVGAKHLAVAVDRNFEVLLNRRDLSVHWRGSVKTAMPLDWLRDDLLCLYDDEQRVMVWSTRDYSTRWSAEGVWICWPWRDRVVLRLGPNEVQLRDLDDGAIVAKPHFGGAIETFAVVGDTMVCLLTDGVLRGVALTSNSTVWATAAGEIYRGLNPPESGAPLAIHPAPDRRGALIAWRSGIGMIDVETGRVQWRRRLVTQGVPLISHGRIGFLHGGNLFLLEQSTGQVINETGYAARTLWESPPIAYGDWMVVVDEQGYIVTVELFTGAIVGSQKEKGMTFNGCVSVDGRLLIAGQDGALWEYAPNERIRPMATNRGRGASEVSVERGARVGAGTSKRKRTNAPGEPSTTSKRR